MNQKHAIKKNTETVRQVKTSVNSPNLVFLISYVLVVTFFSFSPALKNGFINWDDNGYVFENLNLRKPVPEAIQYFFERHYFIGNYIPLTMIAYTLEFHLAGLNPMFYHLVNILIHLVNVALVFWFIYLLSDKKPYVAAIVAVLFGIHPMHVESVVWIAELKDVLYSSFFLAGLISYYKYIEKEGKGIGIKQKKTTSQLFIPAFAFFVLSILSKPAAIIFPVVLLLLDFYTGRKFTGKVWLEKLPFFVVSLVFGIVAIKAQQSDRLIHDYYPFYQRAFFAFYSLVNYVIKFLLPLHLSIFYPYPILPGTPLPYIYYIAPVIAGILCYGVFRTLKYTRLIAFGCLFFLFNIILVLQFLSFGDAIMADRYTYIPYIGLLFIIAMGIDRMYHTSHQKLKAGKVYITPAVILAIIAFASLTYSRCVAWENDDTIATDLLDKFPEDPLALNNKGFILYSQEKFKESINLFNKAIQVKPGYAMAYVNLANAYEAINDFDDAMKITDTALQKAPQDYDVYNVKGYLLCRQNNYAEGLKFYQESIKLKADNITGYISIAACYYIMKDYDNWVKTLDLGLEHAPNNPILLNTRGRSLFLKGNYAEAIPYFKAALNNNPDFTTASANLIACYHAIDSMRGGK